MSRRLHPDWSTSTKLSTLILSQTLTEITIDSVSSISHNSQSPPSTGPPPSVTSDPTDTIANVFVLRPDHPALQAPVTVDNQRALSPPSVTEAIARIEHQSNFATDLASALGSIVRLPYDNSSDLGSSVSSPALPARSIATTNSKPIHRFRQNPGSPANTEETAAPSPVANEFVRAVQLEEGIAYPALDHGRLTGLHSRSELAIDLTQAATVTIDLTYSPPAAAEDQPEIEIVLDCKHIFIR